MYIFGYGSLININSAQKSFKRVLKHDDFIVINLKGFKKVWNAIEYINFEGENITTNGIFLNLKKTLSGSTNGVLLEVTAEEFEFLKLREKNYSCIEINPKSIEGFVTEEKIYTFMTTNKEKIALEKQELCFIPKNYISLLEDGLSPYNEDFQKEFILSYSTFPFEIKEGGYIFCDPVQNKLAKEGI